MNPNEQEQAERLDAWITSGLGGSKKPGVEPAADEFVFASKLVNLASGAGPNAAFSKKLEEQLVNTMKNKAALSAPTTTPGRAVTKNGSAGTTGPRPSLRWLPMGLAAAAVLAVAVIGFLFLTQPPVANAQEIVAKARAAANSPAAAKIQSMELHETSTIRAASGETTRTTATRWFQAPDHWRVDLQSTVSGANGQELKDQASSALSILDGTSVWYFDRTKNDLTISPLPGDANIKENLTDLGPQPDSLNTLLGQASTCYDPRVTGTGTQAGRAVYVIDLGAMKCAGAEAATGRSSIWVDKETYFVLKHVQYDAAGKVEASTEITSVSYNPSLDAGLFSFTPPSGATVQDFRPKPAPSAGQFEQQVQDIAKQAAFPVLVADYVPGDLKPRQPRASAENGVALEYVPADQVDKASAAILSGLLINEQQATAELVARLTEGAKPLQIANGQAWLRTDAPNPVGGGMDKAAYVLQDGTLVSIASFQVSADELSKVAGSFKAAPGAHAPLPNPALPPAGPPTATPAAPPGSLSVNFKVLEPTWLPEEMTKQLDLQPPPPEVGTWVAFTFIPTGGAPVRTPLILFEKPLAMLSSQAANPEAKKVKIGSYDVLLTGSATECWNYDWDIGDVHYSLANPFLESGAARYTCDQMAKIVASIK